MEKIILYLKIAVSVIMSGLSYFFGGFDMLIGGLLMLIVIDYTTGVFAAVVKCTLSSRIGCNGIIKKVCILIVVAVANCVGMITGIGGIRDLTVSFYIANEGISIIENLGIIGVPLPEKLRSVLLQLKNDTREEE